MAQSGKPPAPGLGGSAQQIGGGDDDALGDFLSLRGDDGDLSVGIVGYSVEPSLTCPGPSEVGGTAGFGASSACRNSAQAWPVPGGLATRPRAILSPRGHEGLASGRVHDADAVDTDVDSTAVKLN